MPIRKEDRSRYPKEWPIISRDIRARSEGRCECMGECGKHYGRRCDERNGEQGIDMRGKVILTVAHLDHTPEHCDPENLRAMCQACHLRYDADHHKQTRIKGQIAQKEAEGQLRLLEE